MHTSEIGDRNLLYKAAKTRSRQAFERGASLWDIRDDAEFVILNRWQHITSWKYGGFEPDPDYNCLKISKNENYEDIFTRITRQILYEIKIK